MKFVVVSQRIDKHVDIFEERDALDQRLINLILSAGFFPVPIPNNLITYNNKGDIISHATIDDWLQYISPTAILLSGGNNIGERFDRDLTEQRLLEYAQNNHLPLLGICRGMQMMAHWAGVKLHTVTGHRNKKHPIFGKITGNVNSYHNFSIDHCPKGFEILAESQDGEIEAIAHLTLPWEGWMWHPEREQDFASRDLERIKALFGG